MRSPQVSDLILLMTPKTVMRAKASVEEAQASLSGSGGEESDLVFPRITLQSKDEGRFLKLHASILGDSSFVRAQGMLETMYRVYRELPAGVVLLVSLALVCVGLFMLLPAAYGLFTIVVEKKLVAIGKLVLLCIFLMLMVLVDVKVRAMMV